MTFGCSHVLSIHVCVSRRILFFNYFWNRSTPVEVLHSILLGPYKYLLKTTIPTLNPQQKRELLARMSTFNYSGFSGKVIGNIVYHHKSFVGRDYKAFAQMALFVLGPYLPDSQKPLWITLSKVHAYIHCTCMYITCLCVYTM